MPSNVATLLLAGAFVAVDCLPVGWPVLSRGGSAPVCDRLVDRSGSFLPLDTLRQYAHASATDSQRSPTETPT